MTRTPEQTARSAELSLTHPPGLCLQWSRQRADIGARYPDASTAWWNVADKHRDRNIPRGAMAYWVGGSKGFGHIAVGLGKGQIRSTDAGGAGRNATKPLTWFDINWPSLHYQGWAYEVNGVTYGEDDMPYNDWPAADKKNLANDVTDAIWDRIMEVTKPDGTKTSKSAGRILRETWSKLSRHIDKGG